MCGNERYGQYYYAIVKINGEATSGAFVVAICQKQYSETGIRAGESGQND